MIRIPPLSSQRHIRIGIDIGGTFTDLQILDLRRYEHAARHLDEIGRLVGGWLKTSHAPEAA